MRCFLVFLTLISAFTNIFGQDPIDTYPGIPLVIYPHRTSGGMVIEHPNSLDQMENMGVYTVVAPDVLEWQTYLQAFQDHNLKLIPQYAWGSQTYSYIWKYANTHYSVWEAEGTEPSKGNATLYHDESMAVSSDGNSVWTNNTEIPAGTELIYGPGYPQNVTYNQSYQALVQYHLEFVLKIIPRIPPELPEDYLDDVVCTLRVTNTKDRSDALPGIEEDVIPPTEIRVSDFNGWNSWDTIKLIYNLNEYLTEKINNHGMFRLSKAYGYFMQFKVIWGGLQYLDLYIDKIRVYDDRGRTFIESDVYKTDVRNLVENHLSNHNIIGWYGTDEPGSIDNYEPARIVDSVINAASQGGLRLHEAITGAWRGTFAFGNRTYGMTHDLYVADEFWLRAKPKNIQINTYIYNNPWDSTLDINWKEKNIRLVTDDYYDRINNYDSNFAVLFLERKQRTCYK